MDNSPTVKLTNRCYYKVRGLAERSMERYIGGENDGKREERKMSNVVTTRLSKALERHQCLAKFIQHCPTLPPCHLSPLLAGATLPGASPAFLEPPRWLQEGRAGFYWTLPSEMRYDKPSATFCKP
jgi:hypothetical protein